MKKTFLIAAMLMIVIPAMSSAQDLGRIISSSIGGIQQIAEASKDITPSEEHYIGRAVAATIISKYPLLQNPALNSYLNRVGLLVAAASERPETYGGYHFAVLTSDEPNAYACPGGIILVNQGLLKQIKNEDQLAAILAHEVAHVAHRHGIRAIKKSRWTKFGFYVAGEVGSQYTSDQLGQLAQEFQNVVMDVAKKVMESGYSKGDEKDADSSGMRFAWAAGYNPGEMIEFIEAEAQAGKGHPVGPFSSHPKPADRVASLKRELSGLSPTGKTEKVRTSRYVAAVGNVK
ncbi:MAG TPA: M48 family metalloprotease [bacterium]|jgi:predicted Zn-dependent protease|nr:M48 family metalloprotease [Myxococcales bacterium]OQA59420.1 MAG: TPR repeat-containing protein YfgC precursor [bacterium ADurb.Bin270]HPW44868.1 M48 family metalloprotease [bacterium]HQC50814.1 M48 family metalloprotease [bacterium]HQH79865.1 M48 family metalloprotease [bacterium]